MKIKEEFRKILRRWGQKGGRARAGRLTAVARRKIARCAAQTRWSRQTEAFYSFPGTMDIGEIAPKIVGGSMTAAAIRESTKLLQA